jgi:hypothetical protein
MSKLIITECGGSPTEWEWRVCDAAGQPLRIGWQRSRNVAKQEGERALFKLIGSGGTTYSSRKTCLHADIETRQRAGGVPSPVVRETVAAFSRAITRRDR